MQSHKTNWRREEVYNWSRNSHGINTTEALSRNNENVQEFTVHQAQSSKGGLHFEILNCKPAQRSALDSNLSIV